MSKFHIDEDQYTYVENENVEFWGIKFKNDSPYSSVIVVYGTVSIKEDPKIDRATLSFNYNIQDAGKFNIDELESSTDFNDYLGDVLTYIISNKMKEELETNGYNESATDSRIESSPQ